MKNFKDSIFFAVNHKIYMYDKGAHNDGEVLSLVKEEDENIIVK